MTGLEELEMQELKRKLQYLESEINTLKRIIESNKMDAQQISSSIIEQLKQKGVV